MYKIFLVCILSQTILALAYYNNSIGLKYLHLAKASYCDIKSILKWNCESCHYNQNIQTKYAIENSEFKSLSLIGLDKIDREIIIVFRGTVNLRNWQTDLNIQNTDYNSCQECQIHTGFYNAWKAQKERIIKEVKCLLAQNHKFQVSVVGHSLGGAIATICAVELQQQGIQIGNLITFGAPRIGNQQFADYVINKIPNAIRIVRRYDPVPHLPPRILGYRNFGTEYFYNSDDEFEYEICQVTGEKTCSNQYSSFSRAFHLNDHTNYLGLSTGCSYQQNHQKNDIIYIKIKK